MSTTLTTRTSPLSNSLRCMFALTAVLATVHALPAYALAAASGASSQIPTLKKAPPSEATVSSAVTITPASSVTPTQSGQSTVPAPPPPSSGVPTPPTPAPAPDTSLDQHNASKDAVYTIKCEYVVTRKYMDALANPLEEAAAAAPAPGTSAPAAEQKYPDPTACPQQLAKDARVLDGPGDIVVVVNAKGYAAALAVSTSAKPLRLFLNGFDLGTDGLIAGAERRGEWVALQFHVPNAQFSQAFWTTVYSRQGILYQAPLQASVGWSVEPAFVPDDKTGNEPLFVSVTNWRWLAAASLLAGLMVWFFFWALWGTDTFRVAPTYPWWSDARSLQTKLHRATVPFWLWPFQQRRKVSVDTSNKATLAILAGYYSSFDSTKLSAYQAVAQRVIEGTIPADDDVAQAVVGLALTPDWRTFRLPFSLARVQWGSWMTFATTVAVFLWLVYARFPILEGSVLGLVAVSTLTSGASLIIENGSDKKNTAYSRGFFYDIMTDTDGVQQAHRYQAIVVNILLFAVGFLYVFQHLAYPTFDTSWLELLGISGLAQAAGKGTLEQKKTGT